MMIAPRRFLLFGIVALLSGCVPLTNPCPEPDAVSSKWVPQCLYYLKVIHTDPNNSTVKAQYVWDYRQDKTKALPSFIFRVRDLDHLKLETGKDYYFVRQGTSPFLEPYYEIPKGVRVPQDKVDTEARK
jgi:hypothetical protein